MLGSSFLLQAPTFTQRGVPQVDIRQQAIQLGGIPNAGNANAYAETTNGLLNAVMTIGSLLLLLYLIWGGIEWITAGGDSGKIQKARDKIVQGIIGIIVLASSVAIYFAVRGFVGLSLPNSGSSSVTTTTGAIPVSGSSGSSGTSSTSPSLTLVGSGQNSQITLGSNVISTQDALRAALISDGTISAGTTASLIIQSAQLTGGGQGIFVTYTLQTPGSGGSIQVSPESTRSLTQADILNAL